MAKSKTAEVKPTAQQLKIIGLISITLQVDETDITPGSRFSEDLNADSIDFVEMTMEIEEQFRVEIDDEIASKLLTVADVYKFVEKNAR